MKKIIVFAVFILALGGFASGQAAREVFEKAKQVKFFESNREDVRRILNGFELSDEDEFYQDFSNDAAYVEVSYSSGVCDDDEDEFWDVDEWRVTKIEISFEVDDIKAKDIGVNLSKFEKEQRYANLPDSFIYHDKDSGIAFQVDENGVQKIFLIPPRKNASKLCKNNESAKKLFLSKSWFAESKLEDRILIYESTPNVNDLTLSEYELLPDCSRDASKSTLKVEVSTFASDSENDVLTYKYDVSGGKIIGEGANVAWDLTGVKPGKYTITAGVDDGCGVCGKTVTKAVIVRECPNEKEKSYRSDHFYSGNVRFCVGANAARRAG